ncbi:hypothetical protein BVU17_08440 [Haloarcula taiwanensis]|uniref:Uncharacterized protein n=1 Tax=Haloarcula taiwanensis TaxID=1932004 RepID=A0A2H4ZYH9_9EURY|nr:MULTISPECIES: hypothetical protein [Haloarcula]AUG47541.1 hypothetical protein BVU17_08440 [Haloarcula taiwanensis]RLM34106.1 hypothetical protein DVK01_14950 [Haloarcula sp. Atlit-120R]RLM42754.1 hypothetical protein DVK00_16520 [Haloarcula sp. Atlit-47R]
MSLQATPPTEVSADVSLRVPRGGSETLAAGVADVLAAVDGVEDVAVDRVTSVRPTWTDIRVDADVSLTMQVDGDRTELLQEGFGVMAVNRVDVTGDA